MNRMLGEDEERLWWSGWWTPLVWFALTLILVLGGGFILGTLIKQLR